MPQPTVVVRGCELVVHTREDSDRLNYEMVNPRNCEVRAAARRFNRCSVGGLRGVGYKPTPTDDLLYVGENAREEIPGNR